MSGLYVHVPFCARHCPYCDFAVSTERRPEFRERYLRALETELRGQLAGTEPLATVFFGGGTPTELPAAGLNGLLDVVRSTVELRNGAEIALEANPENLSGEYLRELVRGGWNRLSLGVQSLDGQVLRTLGRAHGPEAVRECILAAREAGFENVSLDLIYAVPGQTEQSWLETLRQAVTMGVTHISAYTLTIEAGTVFGRRAAEGRLIPLTDDSQAEYMETAARELAAGGFERYEVSNWAKPGFACRHNQNYWRGGDYFAAGCGAHGHKQGHRWWNERDAAKYLEAMETTGSAVAGEEFLTPEERLEERLALALRSVEGMDLGAVGVELGIDAVEALRPAVEDAVRHGWIERDGSWIGPKTSSLAVADGIVGRMVRLVEWPAEETATI